MNLTFVYNADAGWFNMVSDIAHKIFSPATYPCSLCDLTYGVFKIRPEWDEFVQQSPVPFVFLHRDEFLMQYPDHHSLSLPVVLKVLPDYAPQVLISADELNDLHSISTLKSLVLSRMNTVV
jgi:hypothetical protein